MAKFTFGAGGRTGARRQNPAGKTVLMPVSFSFPKGTRASAKAGLSTRKPSLWTYAKWTPNKGFEGISAYFVKRTGPTPGSPELALNDNTYFGDTTLVS